MRLISHAPGRGTDRPTASAHTLGCPCATRLLRRTSAPPPSGTGCVVHTSRGPVSQADPTLSVSPPQVTRWEILPTGPAVRTDLHSSHRSQPRTAREPI